MFSDTPRTFLEEFSSKVLKPRYALVLSSNGFHLIFLQTHTFNSYICTLHENHYDMRRIVHVLAIAVIFLLSGCKKYDLMIEELNNRLDALQTGQIASLKQQIDAISISTKQMMDVNNELKEYLDALQATSAELNEKQLATNAKINEIQTLLQGDITESRSDVLSQLESARKQIQTQIDFINSTITTLQSKDSELAQKIEVMNRRIDNLAEKSTSKEWIEETFVTLKQHEALSSDISIIKAQIESIIKSISELEIRLNEKIARDIAEASESMSAEISSKISEITSAYTEAVKKAKEEIGHAYSEAIQTAISALETSLKSWVSEHLNGYYTIAEMDGKLSVLQNSISKDDGQLQTQIDALAKAIADGKSEITSAYTKAIEKAIMNNNGVIDSKIATEIAYTNGRIDSEIKRIEGLLNALEQRISVTENRIATLEEQIIGINNSIVLLEALNLELKDTIEGIIQGGNSSPVEIKLLQEKDEKLEKLIDELRKYVEYQLAETKDWAEGTFATLEQYAAVMAELKTLKDIVDVNKTEIQELRKAITTCESSIKDWVCEKFQEYYTIAEIERKIAELQSIISEGDTNLQNQIDILAKAFAKLKIDSETTYIKAIEDAIQKNNGTIDSKIADAIEEANNSISNQIAALNAKIESLQAQVNKNAEDIAKLLKRIQSVTFIPSHSDGKATLNYSRSGNEFEASLTMRFLVSPKDAVSDLAHNLEVLTLKAVSTTTRTGLFINIPIISCRDEGEGVLLIEAATKDLDARIFEQSTETGISVALSISDGNTDITSGFIPVFVKETIKTTDYVITATYKTDTDNKEMWLWNTGHSICSKDNPLISIDYGDDSFGKEAKHTYEKAGEYTVKFYFEKPCTEISDYAFYSYPISGIHIPKETTRIGYLAFSNSPLESIIFESNSNLTTIEHGAFNFCRKIKSIRLPESVTNIEECVFGGCSSLETVSGGGHGYTTISGIFCYEYFNYDFQSYMDKVLVFPAALNREIWDISFPKQEIGWGAFYGCEYLTKVTASILDIHQYNFIACNKLESINLAETIQIGNNVLNECPKLKEVSAPIASEIGPQCFCDNEALETITLDCDELKTIDQMGCNCINLHTIWIPAGVETISASFNGDAVLTDIYCKATTPPVLTESFNATTELTTIHVPIGSGDIYKNAEGWNNFAESIVEYDFNM